MEDFTGLWVRIVDADGWGKLVKWLFILPYIYEISGADNQLFLLYLEKNYNFQINTPLRIIKEDEWMTLNQL
ncbi:hypothetical protein [Peribacillus sp. SI8-4]|uniref:hypothetical protein n=1 Tax=Peribacillus sp. SI8-4 TaxID=3048009 RepID=UPI002553A76E|nr:hypothetical protein [Peribacillus sp. SI8-4]